MLLDFARLIHGDPLSRQAHKALPMSVNRSVPLGGNEKPCRWSKLNTSTGWTSRRCRTLLLRQFAHLRQPDEFVVSEVLKSQIVRFCADRLITSNAQRSGTEHSQE